MAYREPAPKVYTLYWEQMETIKELLYVPRCESTKRADLVTRAFEIS
jgi:hypothetical protein